MTYMSLHLLIDYMEYEIIISNKTPEALLEIIPKYWILKKEKFKYSIEDIIINELEIEKVIGELLKYSYCLLHTSPCRLCSSKSTIRINNRQHFSEVIKSKNLICDYCKMYSPNFIEENQISYDLDYNLGLLSDEEFNVLRGIIHLKTKFLIYRHIFNNDIEDNSIWEIVNKIQKLGLIWIERDCSWRIKSFHYNSELVELISKL